MTTPDERAWRRRRTAVHEASHAVIAHVTGRTVDLVSVVPTAWRNGVSFDSVPGDLADLDLDVPAAMQAPDLRAYVDRKVMVLLAGDIAGRHLMPPFEAGYYAPSDDELLAERHARALAGLSPEDEARLAAVKPDERDDEGNAVAILVALAEESAGHYLAALRADTTRLVHRWARQILAVADVLEVKSVLSGDQFREIMQGAKP